MSDFLKYSWLLIFSLALSAFVVIYLAVSFAHSSGYSDGYCAALGGESFDRNDFCIINEELVRIK